jgi:hypothetical protein
VICGGKGFREWPIVLLTALIVLRISYIVRHLELTPGIALIPVKRRQREAHK